MTSTNQLAPTIREVLRLHAPAAPAETLDRYAEQIAFVAVFSRSRRLVDSRRGTTPGLTALDKLNRRIIDLATLLDGLGPDELIALRRVNARSAELMSALAQYNDAVVAAYDLLEAEPEQPTRGRGRPSNLTAERVTRCAAQVFERLTGKKARRSIHAASGAPGGAWDDFLQRILDACGIDGSADYRARAQSAKNRSTG